MQQHGWTLLFHDNLIEQMMKLCAAVLRAQEDDPHGFGSNANDKFFRALVQLIQNVVPSNPARDEYRQSNTMRPVYRHWRRAKLGRRYRLFFRYDSKAKVLVYAWINDEQTLRSSGSQILMRCSRKCSDEEIHRMTGIHWSARPNQTGAHRSRLPSVRPWSCQFPPT